MRALARGQSLNQRFTLLRPLGKGGMGEVWLVEDRELDEQVVVKILPPDAPEEWLALLRRECRHARRLVHPNIVQVFDLHRGDKVSFISMAYVEGGDIGQYRGRSPAEILAVVIPIAEALHYAHTRGLVHRDVKVSNVLCDAAGEPHLADFGIAGVLAAERGEPRLPGGGSPYSMSPQQREGEPPHPSDDIYAFGVLVYELITGNPPFWPDVSGERVRSATPEPMASPHPLPASLQSLVSSMLAKSPSDRPPDMAAVKESLREIDKELRAHSEVAPEATASTEERREIRLTPPPRAKSVRPLWPGTKLRLEDEARGRDRRLQVATAGGFAVLVLLAVIVFLVLPQRVQEPGAEPAESGSVAGAVPGQTSSSSAPNPAEVPALPARDLRQEAYAKQEADRALHRVMRWQESLEAKGIELWAPEKYAQASAFAVTGDERLRARDYAGAAEAYTQAIRRLEALDAQSEAVFQQALADGQAALASGDAGSATGAFSLAATISPGESAAVTGLKRAEVLDEVVALLQAGEEHLRNGSLQLASQSFAQAVALDPLSQPAQAALARVRARITDRAFATAMSEGLEAIDRGDYKAARDAFRRARGIKPGSEASAEGLTRAEQGLRLEAIASHRQKAHDFEANEEWHEAAAEYEAVLKLDATIQFAQEGRTRSRMRAALADRLDFHIKNPERLQAEEVLEEASVVLAKASEIEPGGPRHRQQVETLEELLAVAGTPVRVYLESDNLTEVTVYKVGRLGTFSRRALDLHPGTYTVVGRRSGYRDVRQQLVVVPGEEREPFVVRCEEEI